MNRIKEFLIKQAQPEYKKFNEKIVPDTKYEMLGVRLPVIKKLAREIRKDNVLCESFLKEKHFYYEEYMLHGLLISEQYRNINDLLMNLDIFMPDIDNWAICDSVAASLKIDKNDKKNFFEKTKILTRSPLPYTVRFGIVCMLDHFMEEEYLDEIINVLSKTEYGHYYVDMAAAWLLSVMLVKFYDYTIKLFITPHFIKFVHNKAIQKAVESRRISESDKLYLKTLKIL